MPFCTKIRLAQTQVWPELRNLHAIAPLTAVSRSASSKTMKGALPPSSKDSFFSVSEDCFINSFPTPVDPVNDTFRTVGLDVRASPTSAVFFRALTKFTTPFGIPAREANSAMARDVKGVSPGDLQTTVHPAAMAGPIFRVIIAAGKFHLNALISTPVPLIGLGCVRSDETTNSYRFLDRENPITSN